MIEGLRLKVSGKELHELALRQAAHLRATSEKRDEAAKALEPEERAWGENRRRADSDRRIAERLDFIASHLVLDETYMLLVHELQDFGIDTDPFA